jgi:hypothetical protein
MTSSGTISGKIKREGVKKLDTLKFLLSFFALSTGKKNNERRLLLLGRVLKLPKWLRFR